MNERLVTPQGYTLAITENIVPGARVTAIMLHGFDSSRNSGRIKAGIDVFEKLQISTVCPDFYGRGESDGIFGDLTVSKGIETAVACIAHVKQRDPKQKIILTGGSFGGFIALHTSVQHKDDIALLIVRSSVSDWGALWMEKLSTEDMSQWQKTGSITTVISSGREETFGRDFYNDIVAENNIYDLVSRMTIPTLIIHGDADEVVPVEQSVELKKHIPLSDLVIVPGADHRFSRPEDMAEYQHHIENFLRKSRLI